MRNDNANAWIYSGSKELGIGHLRRDAEYVTEYDANFTDLALSSDFRKDKNELK